MSLTRFVGQVIGRERSHASRALLAVACFVAATAIRVLLADTAAGVPFVTYFPAVMICTLLCGWDYGLGCAAASAILANWLFIGPGHVVVGDGESLLMVAFFVVSCVIIIAVAETLRLTLAKLDRANARADALNRELHHRVRNTLTVVQALARQTAKGADPQEFVQAFTNRLQALATANSVLTREGDIESCRLPDLMNQACDPFLDHNNLRFAGPDCDLDSASCVPLVLALHELCTNALKHGALSCPEGRVDVHWSCEGDDRIVIRWEESGGPPVGAPARKGVGSSLLRAQPGLLEVETHFAEGGLTCRIVVARCHPPPPQPSSEGPGIGALAVAGP